MRAPGSPERRGQSRRIGEQVDSPVTAVILEEDQRTGTSVFLRGCGENSIDRYFSPQSTERGRRKFAQMTPHSLLPLSLSSIPLIIIILAITPFHTISVVDSCSCRMPSLRESLCRSKYSAIVQALEADATADAGVRRTLSALTSPATTDSSSSSKERWEPLTRRRDGHEHEGEKNEENDTNYKAHRMTIMSVISVSQEGEKALRTQLMWTKLPPSSSCNPIIQPGKRYLMFGDVSADGKAFVTVCNLIKWESLTASEREEIRGYKESGLRCR